MPTSGWLSVPTPTAASPVNVPADLLAMVAAFDKKGLGFFATATARDAAATAAGGATAGMLAYLGTPQRWTFYTGTAWVVVASAVRIGCSATGTANVSAANNVVTAAPLASEFYDSDAFHSTVTNNSRVTIPAGLAGVYDVTAHARPGGTALGVNNFYGIRKNSNLMLVRSAVPNHSFASGNPSRRVSLAAGDYVELVVYQNSGATISDAISAVAENTVDPHSPLLEVTYMGPG